ncbi:MAG: 50S ribosomal protein L11 methyltransferase [Gemmobacter sp.]|nr:50S ribosomal protein L11 methyltransferase [Gemmobacter sp.]
MPTFSALTTLPGQDAAEALAEALESLTPEPSGVGVFEIEDGSGLWEVGAYFLEPPDRTILLLLSTAFGANPFVLSEIPEIDWVAKVRRDLAPVEAGRFWLYGSHDAATVPQGVIPLQIEATVAFGTGHHGTTLGCLRAVDRLAQGGMVARNVADIGSGTGVLAMAAARLWPEAAVIASDIDEVAVEVALANAEINALADRVPCVEAAGFDHPELAARAPYDLIFANILKGPLIELAPAMAAHAAPGGILILSGLLVTQAADVTAAYVAAGFTLTAREDIGDWATLVLTRS